MTSPAAGNFARSLHKAQVISRLAVDPRLRPLPRQQKSIYLHAALAVYVAFWELYVKSLVDLFFVESNDPIDVRFSSAMSYLKAEMVIAKGRLNTPNSNNARDFIYRFTGYDPIGDWIWPQHSMSGPAVRDRLDEILKLRHSFAHGFAMPSFGWNTSSSGIPRLTNSIITDVEGFFVNIVSRTDRGMKNHILSIYNPNLTW